MSEDERTVLLAAEAETLDSTVYFADGTYDPGREHEAVLALGE